MAPSFPPPPIFPAAAVLAHLVDAAGGLETTATAHLVSDSLPLCCIRFVSLTSSGSLSSSYRSPTQPHRLSRPFCPAPTRIASSAPTACPDPFGWGLSSSVGFACDGRGGGRPFRRSSSRIRPLGSWSGHVDEERAPIATINLPSR